MLIGAAAVVLCALLVAAAWWTQRSSAAPARTPTPAPSASAASPTPQGTTVEIDLYSGRTNPTFTAAPSTIDQLYWRLADRQATGDLVTASEPSPMLGFRGLIVPPEDPARPSLRVLPTGAYLTGSPTKLFVSHEYYDLLYLQALAQVDPAVVAELPLPSFPVSKASASVPPLVGETASWRLADPAKVTRGSTTFGVLVTRQQCSNGTTGRLMAPVVSTSASDVVIRVDAVPNPPGSYTCPGNDEVEVTVTLPEPLGSRRLLDAACLEGDALVTSTCAGGAVRWLP